MSLTLWIMSLWKSPWSAQINSPNWSIIKLQEEKKTISFSSWSCSEDRRGEVSLAGMFSRHTDVCGSSCLVGAKVWLSSSCLCKGPAAEYCTWVIWQALNRCRASNDSLLIYSMVCLTLQTPVISSLPSCLYLFHFCSYSNCSTALTSFASLSFPILLTSSLWWQEQGNMNLSRW